MTSFTTFRGTDPPVDKLPPDFRTAILNSQAGKSTPADDNVIGSALAGAGYCSQDEFKKQLYCACVNAPIANPECIFAPCTNYTQAYKTTAMQDVLTNTQKNCPTTVNCTQVFEMGGSGNIASGVSQTMNCGGVVETFITNIQTHPFLAIVVLILIISVIMLVSAPRARQSSGDKPLLPPDLVIPIEFQ